MDNKKISKIKNPHKICVDFKLLLFYSSSEMEISPIGHASQARLLAS